MRRLGWLGLGIVIGVIGHRRAQQLLASARSEGIVPTVTRVGADAQATASAATAVLRSLAGPTAVAPKVGLGDAAAVVMRGGRRTWTPQRSEVAS